MICFETESVFFDTMMIVWVDKLLYNLYTSLFYLNALNFHDE